MRLEAVSSDRRNPVLPVTAGYRGARKIHLTAAYCSRHNRNHSYLWRSLVATTAITPTLNRLRPGECGTILALDADEELGQRLVALGLRIGKSVRLLRRARFGGPLHVRVDTTELMLRRREAHCIRLTHASPVAPLPRSR